MPIIGPRQTTGRPFFKTKPREAASNPVPLNDAEAGVRLEADADAEHRRDVGAGKVCVQQAHASAVLACSAIARLTATVDLPTPPLFEATAMMLRTPSIVLRAPSNPVDRTAASIVTSAL